MRDTSRTARHPSASHAGKWWQLGIVGLLSCLLLPTLAIAQGGGALTNPISYFQVQEGSTAVSWSQTSAMLDASNGNSIVTYQDGVGGSSVMTWLSTGTLSNWTITLVSGSTQSYTDGLAQGQAGGFILTSGAFGTNNVLSINGHPYVPSGGYLVPANSFVVSLYWFFGSFTYNGSVFQRMRAGIDYLDRKVGVYSNGNALCTSLQTQEMQLYFADGTQAYYTTDRIGRVYVYQNSSTAANLLSQIDGFPLTGAGGSLSLPAPIVSIVCAGQTATLSRLSIGRNDANTAYQIIWVYEGAGQWGVGAASNPDGSLNNLMIDDGNRGESLYPAGTAGGFNSYQCQGDIQITGINGIPYVLGASGLLVPQSPVSSFAFGGNTYVFTDASPASNHDWVGQYQTTGNNPQSATVEYSPSTGIVVKLSINSASGGTATYVNGASVGQPGAYVWSTASTAANLLSSVNNSAYNPSGSSDLPTTAQTTNGIFQIAGNFLSLGTWSNNASQSGFSLSYYDGQPVTVPASIEFTASRPLTSWLWDAATADGTSVTPVMQVDQSSRLLLYPQGTSTAANAPATPAPAVILDPSANNPSEFAGVVRFDGAVRVAPQGDLSMGAFTQDPFPAQPTQ